MDMTEKHTFTKPVDVVWEMFCTEAAHVAKFESMGHREIKVLKFERDDDGVLVEVQRLVDMELPGFAKKVMKPTNTVVSTDRWKANADGSYGGTFLVDTTGAPLDVKGTTILRGEGDTTKYEIFVEVKVNVPLIGGRIANFAKGVIDKQFEHEFAAGDAWLAEHA